MVDGATYSVETVVVLGFFPLHSLVVQHTELQELISWELLASLAVMSEHTCSSVWEQFTADGSDEITWKKNKRTGMIMGIVTFIYVSTVTQWRIQDQMKPCCLAVMSANSFASRSLNYLISYPQCNNIWCISYISFTYHGKLWTQNLPAPNVSGFIAQLVRASHRYHEVAGTNAVEVLKIFRLLDANEFALITTS